MLPSAIFLAKFWFDTAENEPAKNLQKFAKKPMQRSAPGANRPGRTPRAQQEGPGDAAGRGPGRPRREGGRLCLIRTPS